jgi:hypothetical protein
MLVRELRALKPPTPAEIININRTGAQMDTAKKIDKLARLGCTCPYFIGSSGAHYRKCPARRRIMFRRSLFVLAALLAAWLIARTDAFAATTIVVRSCTTKPATDGFGACANSLWVLPTNTTYVNVRRRNVTDPVWIRPSEFIEGDRAYACETVPSPPQPFANCSAPITGQTDNWLDVGKVTWIVTAVTPSLTFAWTVPPLNTNGTPFLDADGYHVSIRRQMCDPATANCPDAGYTIAEDLSVINTKYTVMGEAYEWCIIVQARNSMGTLGPLSDPSCSNEIRPKPPVPGKVTTIRVESVVK